MQRKLGRDNHPRFIALVLTQKVYLCCLLEAKAIDLYNVQRTYGWGLVICTLFGRD
jgi:hypothetical protein